MSLQIKERTGSLKCGSLTIEASLILPILLFCLLTMISFMDVYRIETEELTALCQSAMQEGTGAYGMGIEEDIESSADYSYTPLQMLFPLPAVSFHTEVTVHPWTGTDGASADVSSGVVPEKMVYMTASGSVIHLDPHCSYLDIHIRAVSGQTISERKNSHGVSYHACEICSRGQDPAPVVYITDGGTKYHNSGTCSGIKRTVRLVPESEAAGCSFCTRCGGE